MEKKPVQSKAAQPIQKTTVQKPSAQLEAKKPVTSNNNHNNHKIRLSLSTIPFFTTILVFILIAILSSGIVFYAKVYLEDIEVNRHEIATTTLKAPTPTIKPTPTATEIDYSTYNVSVLNGSGVVGTASTVSTLLTDNGFNVISTGNAATADYTNTIVNVKDEVPSEVRNKIIEILTDTYPTSLDEPLEATSSYDILVTVGTTR